MDYNYIRLENMIKQLMNKSYVPSSSRAKSTEEIYNGSCKLYIDTVLNRYVFKYSTLAPSIMVDPINRSLLNVQYINNVDISKLIGGVAEGYGININNMGEGIYQINVVENMFALLDDLSNYTPTEVIEATYATKNALELVDNKFADYTNTAELEENYLQKSYIDTFKAMLEIYPTNKYVDDTFATKAELESNLELYLKKEDYNPGDSSIAESHFELVDGYSYYTVKHSDITIYTQDTATTQFNAMKITIRDEALMTQIKASPTKIAIFKINLRKHLLIDFYGNILNDFVIYYNPEKSKFEAPLVSYYDVNDSHKLDYRDLDNIEAWFDEELGFHPYTEYLNGELVIEYLLSQNALVSNEPTLRCEIIEAKNALRLRESDVYYFYRPSMILFNSDVKYMESNTEWSCECYQMIFKIPESYSIPINLDFSFKEYCFGNTWALKWDGDKWCGDNIQGRINPKIVRKCNMRAQKDGYGATGCYCMVKKDTWNSQHIPSNTNGLAFSLFENSSRNTIVQFKDGSSEPGSNYNLLITYSGVLRGAEYKGYDLVVVNALYNNYDAIQLKIEDIDVLYLDLTLPNQSTTNRLSFIVSGVHHDEVYNRGHLDIAGSLDTIEAISGTWNRCSLDSGRDIVLYLNKTYTQAIDEVNWDPSTNAFSYIIQQQFYEVSPNPNAATTLYTDYNILHQR